MRPCELPRMPRPLRTDYPGAMHHVFVRAVPRTELSLDPSDYARAHGFLERAISRFELRCHAWCYLPNHAHFLLTSQHGNLSRAMHWLGTCTAQSFNQRHERYGHLYQGRFGSRLVKNDKHFLELARYLPLNPVRAGLCPGAAIGRGRAIPRAWDCRHRLRSSTPRRFSKPSARSMPMSPGSQMACWQRQSMTAASRPPLPNRLSKTSSGTTRTRQLPSPTSATDIRKPPSRGTWACTRLRLAAV